MMCVCGLLLRRVSSTSPSSRETEFGGVYTTCRISKSENVCVLCVCVCVRDGWMCVCVECMYVYMYVCMRYVYVWMDEWMNVV
jgi:hypothetical protein